MPETIARFSSHEKLVGLNINEIPNKKFSKEVFKSLDGKPGYYEGAYSSYTGKKLAMIQAYWIPIFHDDEVQSGIGIVEDITERVRTEDSLQESERQLQTLIDAMPDFVCFKDGAGRWLKANEASIRIFRLEDIDYQGKKDSELAELDSYLRGSFLTCKESDARAWKERPLLRVEETIPHPDGSVRVYDVIKVPVFHPGGERKGLVVLGRDITERVQAAESLKQSTEELTRLYRASGVLLASATPDLDSLAQTIVETILLEFEHTNCSLLLVQPGSQELNRLAVAGPYANEVSTGILRLDGSGLVPRAIRSGEIVNFPDVTVSPDYVPNWDAARSELAVPLKIDQRVIGVIDVQSVKPGAFNTNDERLMLTFAERAALALENARLFSEANRRLKRIGALHTIDKAISTSFDINMTAGVFLEQALTYLEVDAANILLFNPAIHTLECIGRKGFRTSALKYTDLRLGQDLAGQVALQREIKYIPDLQEDAEVYLASPELSGEEFVAYYGIPLVAKGVLKGVLEIFHRTPLSADDEWLMFLNALAGQAAIAIDNASMFTDLQRSNFELGLAYDSTLEGWARALELRDMETEGHSRRVTEMTMRLARAMGVSSEALVHIRRGALLHDIGKMGIPDSILFKSGKLDRGEWAIMHQHTIWAYKMLSPIAYLRPALDIPRYHHEKWDGSGYPQGLHGEQIPLAARIFAIVDVWDALTSNRPYREAWPEDKVIQYIREQSGVHFDPRVVDAFFAIIGKTK